MGGEGGGGERRGYEEGDYIPIATPLGGSNLLATELSVACQR